MIDPSIFETVQLVLRPFTDELGEGWKIVRAVCVLFLMVTIVLWIAAYFAPEPRFLRAKEVMNVSGWVTFLMFVFTYLACCVEAYSRHKERVSEKMRKLDEFR